GSLRGPFLRWFLVEAIPALNLPLIHFELRDAVIADVLDLSGTKSKILPRFANCDFKDTIDLSDAEMLGFEMIACRAAEIFADRLTTKGSFRVCIPAQYDAYPAMAGTGYPPAVTGNIRLCGAKTSGNLDLRGGRFPGVNARGEPAVPIFADGAHVEGSALLSKGFRADGEVRLNGCTIDRNLNCFGATFVNLRGYSLSAAGAHIVGCVYLGAAGGPSSEAEAPAVASPGFFRLKAAAIDSSPGSLGSQFTATALAPEFSAPDPPPSAARVAFASFGSFRLEGAKIDGDLDCRDGQFTATAFAQEGWKPVPAPDTASNEDLYAIKANGVEIGGDVEFSGKFHAQGIVNLIGARIEGDFNCEDGFFDFPGEEPLQADGITVYGTTFLNRG